MPEVIRIIKPGKCSSRTNFILLLCHDGWIDRLTRYQMMSSGGMFIWAQRAQYLDEDERLSTFHEDVQKLCNEGKWKRVTFEKRENFIYGRPGFLYAMQIL